VTTTGTTATYEHMFHSFGLKENPFSVSPDPRFLFSGPSYENALAELMFGIEAHRGLLVLTGEAGTGKTTLMRHFLQWLNGRQFSSSYIFHTHLDPADLFEFVLRDFGVPVESTKKSDLLATLHRWLHTRQAQGDSPVIVIDEAQALSLRTLRELNLLLNLENVRGKLVQIVLAGQPELEDKLRRPESRALRQRIMVRCRLPLLSLEETQEYIAARLLGAGGTDTRTFPLGTVQTIYSYARGVPRLVNLLCEQALIGAYAERSTTVSTANVRRVAAEFDLVGEPFQATSLESEFTSKYSASVASAFQSVAPARPSVSDEVPATAEIAAREKTLAAAAAESAAPVAQGRYSAPVAEPMPEPPVFDSAVLAEEQAVVGPEPRQAELPAMQPAADEPVRDAALDVVGLSEDKTPAQSALETPELETVAAAMRNEPAPPPAESPVSPEEASSLHIVPPAEKRQPAHDHTWRKHRKQRAFVLYWRDVAQSFVRDWRAFFASCAPLVSAVAGNVPQRAASLRRRMIAQLRSWLRAPINTGSPRHANSDPVSTRVKKS
jgi:general secretion pathway protein A